MAALWEETRSEGSDPANVRWGMVALREHMQVPGIAAFWFAASINSFDEDDDWAADFGATIAALKAGSGQASLQLALSSQLDTLTYLAIDIDATHFLVLHGLRRWSASAQSISAGKVVAWVGETISPGPPDMWRLEDNDNKLFEDIPFAGIGVLNLIDFYSYAEMPETFLAQGDHSQTDCAWVSRLIPIQTRWAPFFLDHPTLGVAVRRVTDLIHSVSTARSECFRHLLTQMACACHSRASRPTTSAMALNWTHLPRSKPNLQVSGPAMKRSDDIAKAEGEEDSSDMSEPHGTRKSLPEHLDGYASLFGRANKSKFLNYRDYVQSPPHGPSYLAVTQQHASPAAVEPPLIAAVMQAQTEAATANNANMIAFTTVTAQALATSAGGDKASKLTQAKKLILQACTGDSDSPIFIPPPCLHCWLQRVEHQMPLASPSDGCSSRTDSSLATKRSCT